MPTIPLDARPTRLRTRLEDSLIRLQTVLRRGIQREADDETLYAQWQSRWAGRREELSRRLTAIDSQLESWAPESRSTPRLAVLGDCEETAMFGFCDESGFGPLVEVT